MCSKNKPAEIRKLIFSYNCSTLSIMRIGEWSLLLLRLQSASERIYKGHSDMIELVPIHCFFLNFTSFGPKDFKYLDGASLMGYSKHKRKKQAPATQTQLQSGANRSRNQKDLNPQFQALHSSQRKLKC